MSLFNSNQSKKIRIKAVFNYGWNLFKSKKTVLSYLITNIIARAVPFLLLPFFLKYLSKESIGTITLFSTSVMLLNLVASNSFCYSVNIDFFKYPKEQFAKIFSSIIYIPLAIIAISIPIFYFLSDFTLRHLSFQNIFYFCVPLTVLFNIGFEGLCILLRNTNNSKLYFTINIFKVLIDITVAVLLIYVFMWQWEGRIVSIMISGGIIFVYFIYYVHRQEYLTYKFDWKSVKAELPFTIPGLIMQGTIFCISNLDKYFVAHFFGTKTLAEYSVAWTFASILYIVCLALIQYIQPLYYRKFQFQVTHWSVVKLLFRKYLVTMGIAFVLMYIGTWIAFRFIIDVAYLHSLELFYILGIGAFIWTISSFFQPILVYFKKVNLLYSLNSIIISITFILLFLGATTYSIIKFAWILCLIHLIVLIIILIGCYKLNFFKKVHPI